MVPKFVRGENFNVVFWLSEAFFKNKLTCFHLTAWISQTAPMNYVTMIQSSHDDIVLTVTLTIIGTLELARPTASLLTVLNVLIRVISTIIICITEKGYWDAFTITTSESIWQACIIPCWKFQTNIIIHASNCLCMSKHTKTQERYSRYCLYNAEKQGQT